MKFFGLLLGVICVGAASAATISVSAPSNGDYFGKSNTVKYNLKDMVSRATINVVATSVDNPTVSIAQTTTNDPDSTNSATGSLPFNLTATVPQGNYTLQVTATESGSTYNIPAPISIIVDVIEPKFVNFNPISGAYFSGKLLITATLLEPNIKEWRVQANGSDIPNNTGNTTDVSVLWDATSLPNDGKQSITINATDKALNTANRQMDVTLDRLPPSITVLSPLNNQAYRPGSDIPVTITIADQFADSLDERFVSVLIQDTAGRTLGRVARRQAMASGNSLIWIGRLRHSRSFPSQFNIVTMASDKAGNSAVSQTVMVSNGRSVKRR